MEISYIRVKFKNIIGNPNFSDFSNELLSVSKKLSIYRNYEIVRQTACLVFNPFKNKKLSCRLSVQGGVLGLRLNDGFDVNI